MKALTGYDGKKMMSGLLVSVLALQLACADDVFAPEEIDQSFQPMTTAEFFEPAVDTSDLRIDPIFWVDLLDEQDTESLFVDGVAEIESPDAFEQVSWMMDAEDVSDLQYRVRQGAEWSAWKDVEITWNEGKHYNASIVLDEPATELEMRGGEGIINAQMEFYETVVARDEFIVPTPVEQNDSDIRTIQSAVAPSSLVTSRHEWGATDPDRTCGQVVDPYRMAIHHTAIPADDGGDAAARMRQMQNFHMNDRGWCDIGYHFVVAQSGQIYQGRSQSNRPGAHVGGQNSGNVGIALIGNFDSQQPSDTQMSAAGDIMQWVHQTHGVPLDTNSVLGHNQHPGQSTACPGQNLSIAQLLEYANGSTTQGSAPAPDTAPTNTLTPDSDTASPENNSTPSGSVSFTGGCSSAAGAPSNSPIIPLVLAMMGLMALRVRRPESFPSLG